MMTENNKKSVIRVENLTMGWPGKILLENVSFDILQNEIVFIMGGSGCGKSTLMKTIIGLNPPMAGDILIRRESIIHSDQEKIAEIQRGLGIMYQSGALFGSLTVLENVRFPLDQFTKLPMPAKDLTSQMLLAAIEMPHAANLMPGELSGGMIKRAGIARALALGATILLLDEPSAGLDPITAANLDETILRLRKNLNCTFVIVSHELKSIFRIADRCLMLDPVSKSIIADGSPEELREHSPNPRVRQFFNAQPDGEE
ncbi:ABC transporter ATP-binding protein [Turicimonas muris]|uniref:ABC transporter ATP-binding protein n=1 Tax=Turicimonas muris TaxID=1796652 RepID=UPI0024959AF4|nr:ATP-binding cassette domain-containing protein [Turicimonas muris]